MRANRVRAAWSRGACVINGWLQIPNAFSAEVMAHCGWDSLCIDLQHGLVDYQAATTMMQAISTTEVTPLVRIPWNDPAILMKCLDAGAFGAICPMVNDAEQARQFVGASKYPPLGFRSMGPIRAQIYAGADYAAKANDELIALAMIETQDGLGNLDAILSVQGLDGVYIGPADLSLSLGSPARLDPTDSTIVAAIDHILARCKHHGRRCGIHTGSADYAQKMVAKGFDLVTILGDSRILGEAASALVRRVKGDVGEAPKSSTY